MRAEVIAIGDELTSGLRLDTNSPWLSQKLEELGVRVVYHTTVADDLEANVNVFRAAAERAELIVATGGLGPTADDLTRQAIALAVDRPLVVDESALAHVQKMFTARGRPMPERNRVQAEFPQGASVIPNPHGTAPGIDLTVVRAVDGVPARIFALPGVPAEMHEMWEATVVARIGEMLGSERRVTKHVRLKVFGVGESHCEEMLPDLIRRGRQPTVGITVSRATITLRVTSTASSPAACDAEIQPTVQIIRDCLGNLIFGAEEDELQHAIVRLLQRSSQTLATAEWGTAGLLARWLRDVPGSAAVYRGGKVVSEAATAQRLFEIPVPSPTADDSEISRTIVTCMAERVRARFGARIGLAVGDFPSPGPTSEFYVGLALPERLLAEARPYSGHPDILLHRSAKQALDVLRHELLRGLPCDD